MSPSQTTTYYHNRKMHHIISRVGLLLMLSVVGVLLFPSYKYEQFIAGRGNSYDYVKCSLLGKHDSMDDSGAVRYYKDYKKFKGIQWSLVIYNLIIVGALSAALYFALLQAFPSLFRVAFLLRVVYIIMMLFVFAVSSFKVIVVLLNIFPIENNYFFFKWFSDAGLLKQFVVCFYYGLWVLVSISSFLDVKNLFRSISLREAKITTPNSRYINISTLCVMLLAVIQFSPLSEVVFYSTSTETHWSLVTCIVFCIFRITQDSSGANQVTSETTPLEDIRTASTKI